MTVDERREAPGAERRVKKRGPNTEPVDLIVDGNEYVEMRDRINDLTTALQTSEAARARDRRVLQEASGFASFVNERLRGTMTPDERWAILDCARLLERNAEEALTASAVPPAGAPTTGGGGEDEA